jgi:hypothetical protein
MIISETELGLPKRVFIVKLDLAYDSTFVMLYSHSPIDKYNPVAGSIMNFGKKIINKF